MKNTMPENQQLLPFFDPQDALPRGFCQRCGREIYGWGGQCLYCARELPWN